jgi:RimJ/RimL family protein N-acetyltransferase
MPRRSLRCWRRGVRHDIVLEGASVRIRPVEMDDAAFIAGLRSDPVRARYLHRISGGIAAQQQWLAEYFVRPGDYYFIIENRATEQREGTAGIYDVDPVEGTAEWGRWILRPGSIAAVESACLVYRAGFEKLALESVYCRTIAENVSALAFHDSFGVQRRKVLPAYFELDGRRLDAIEGCLTRERFQSLPPRVTHALARAASRNLSTHA